ncbi:MULTISPECIES: tyrosine aminotransferase [unclassified Ensifer]|uniref:tyrosine aminotransferase n=1 Tax=unclassified Ensifer TaxID=2633371 RepID=UPI000812E0C4|nr:MULTISPECIES: tyrosine aminotransferase [unclassified Ensifer]OCP07503.1 aromatic amino acid aminotransferase [Ensifer sp. LC11]OCP07609.1 aromatic amino acid aminotransferase [Ensifer sp. LC14]OCP08277.1 aromatic amino acid aminotransferase [Ensifer sp. LC13]OCP31998.1 aromatic amino acid aminotransferase [Ensifer sp. LC499]
MFDALTRQPDDPLLALIGLYRKDERPGKVDLGVGVYRDETGHTPIFRAVKAAEKRLLESQDSKAYVGPEGDLVFVDHLWTLVGGDTVDRSHVAGVQTPGGSGALRLAADLIRQMGGKRIWIGLPSWANHASIFKAAGLEPAGYPFFDVPSQTVLFDNMMTALQGAAAGDAVLLHASCHNPTGGVITDAQWMELATVIAERGLLPLVDLAYQGFGRGLDEDVAGLRHLIGVVPEALVAVSCSKSFGLYRERAGAIFAVTSSASSADTVRSNLAGLARTSYSMPPDHGAAIVRLILSDAELSRDWRQELETMRLRITNIRRALAEGLRDRWQALGAVAGQEGMFSLLPLAEADVMRLRNEHGIYMPGSGRINIAGLKTAEVDGVIAKFKDL